MTSEANNSVATFKDCAFKPEREELATHLTNYLKLQKNGYVLNVDGEWGCGKTFFLKSWEYSLKEQYPTCYIDAWTLDYLNDPLATLSRKILDAVHKNLAKHGLINPSKEKKILNNLYRLISTSAHIGSSIIENTLNPVAGKIISTSIAQLDSYLLSSGQSQFELFKKSEDALIEFRKSLEDYIAEISKKNEDHGKFFIFIDELDRCRPNYSIELLEAVKHLFRLKNTIFIIATNRNEMEKSIENVYGRNFHSNGYLSRFFDRSISLSRIDTGKFLENRSHVSNLMSECSHHCYTREKFATENIIEGIFESYELKPREIEKIVEQTIFAIKYLGVDKFFSLFLLIDLFCKKEVDHRGFSAIRPTYIPHHKIKSINISVFTDRPKTYKLTSEYETINIESFIAIEVRFQMLVTCFKKGEFVAFTNANTYNLFENRHYFSRNNDLEAYISRPNTSTAISMDELFDCVDYSTRLQ